MSYRVPLTVEFTYQDDLDDLVSHAQAVDLTVSEALGVCVQWFLCAVEAESDELKELISLRREIQARGAS
jgi:hypothetical protein